MITEQQRISELITLAKYHRCLFCAVKCDNDKNFCSQECDEHYFNYIKVKGGFFDNGS